MNSTKIRLDQVTVLVGKGMEVGPLARGVESRIFADALQHKHQLIDTKKPPEFLRTVHSFDPCMACAIHVTDHRGEEPVRVKVN